MARQAPVIEPVWRGGSPLRDSLTVRWRIPVAQPAVEMVELQHDEGFGGNFTVTLSIRPEKPSETLRRSFNFPLSTVKTSVLFFNFF